MLKGKALFAGTKEFMSKNGNLLTICKLFDSVSGELAEIFVSKECYIPNGIKIMSPVDVEISWSSYNGRTSFSLVSISQGV
jgi:hypothetical protein